MMLCIKDVKTYDDRDYVFMSGETYGVTTIDEDNSGSAYMLMVMDRKGNESIVASIEKNCTKDKEEISLKDWLKDAWFSEHFKV